MALPDIGAEFVFREWTQGGYSYKEGSGELGVPAKSRPIASFPRSFRQCRCPRLSDRNRVLPTRRPASAGHALPLGQQKW